MTPTSHHHTFEPMPPFQTYEEEAEFWDTHDMTDLTQLDTGKLDEVATEVLRQQGNPKGWQVVNSVTHQVSSDTQDDSHAKGIT